MKRTISTLMIVSAALVVGMVLVPLDAAAKKPSPYITVNCDAGESIQTALDKANPSVPLTLTVQGSCEEDVNISRDSVTMNGVSGATISGTVTVDGSHHIELNGLTFTGPGQGIKVFGGDVDLGVVTISGNAEDGLWVTQNSWVSLNYSEVTGNGLSGVYVQRSEFDANNSEISGNASDGVLSDQNGHSVFRNTAIDGNGRNGLSLLFHSIAELKVDPQFEQQMSVTANQGVGVYMREDSGLRITTEGVTVEGNTGGIACDDDESSFANYGGPLADSVDCTGFDQ